jgi:hypothetical protein
VKLYTEGVKEWGEVISRFDSLDDSNAVKGLGESIVSTEKAEDDLAAWLEKMEMEEGVKEECGCAPKVNADRVMLYQCSWCRNPSAALRKCSGCSKTRCVLTGDGDIRVR